MNDYTREKDDLSTTEGIPTIRTGSRWRNRVHGFVFSVEYFHRASDTVRLSEKYLADNDGFVWIGTRQKLFQQWKEDAMSQEEFEG